MVGLKEYDSDSPLKPHATCVPDSLELAGTRPGNPLAGLGHAVGTPARLASALFADVPLNAQINLLTSTSFDRPQDLFSVNAGAPRGVAYVSLAAPTGRAAQRLTGR